MSCWYSLNSSREVLSDEYPFARGFDHFLVFLHHFVLAKLAASSVRVNVAIVAASLTYLAYTPMPCKQCPHVCLFVSCLAWQKSRVKWTSPFALRAHFAARSFQVLNIAQSHDGLFPLNCIKMAFWTADDRATRTMTSWYDGIPPCKRR